MVISLRATATRAMSFGFPAATSFVAEAFELRIVARGDHGADEQGAAYALATAADEALAAPLPALAGPGCKPDKGRDLSTVERTEFRQFGDQGPGDCLSDAGHGSEKILLLDPDGRSDSRRFDTGLKIESSRQCHDPACCPRTLERSASLFRLASMGSWSRKETASVIW
jgi:hypothetical protein